MEVRKTPAGLLVQQLYNQGFRDVETVMSKTGLAHGTVRQYLAACRQADPENPPPPPRKKGTVRGHVPDNAPMKQKIANAFVSSAREVLRKRGEPHTIRALSEILEATPAFISSCLTGRQGSLDTLYRWLSNWERKGYPAFVLRIDGDSFTLKKAR